MFLRHQGKGEPFDLSARRHNAIADATNDFLSRKFKRGGPAGVANFFTLMTIANGTGTDWAMGDAVAIGTPVVDPGTNEDRFLSKIIFSGTRPVTANYGAFGICVEPIRNGASGYVAFSGIMATQVVVPTNGTWIKFADVTNDSYALTLRPEGTARVLWREGGTSGTEWAIVQLGVSADGRELKGVSDEALVADASGTVSVWSGGADTLYNVEAELNWMHGAEDVSTGKELVIKYFADEAAWVVVHAECE